MEAVHSSETSVNSMVYTASHPSANILHTSCNCDIQSQHTIPIRCRFHKFLESSWFLLSLRWWKPSVKCSPTPWLCDPVRTLFLFRIDAQSSLSFVFCHNLINFSSRKSFSTPSVHFSLGLPTFLLSSDLFLICFAKFFYLFRTQVSNTSNLLLLINIYY
jgi:hypothetical protein